MNAKDILLFLGMFILPLCLVFILEYSIVTNKKKYNKPLPDIVDLCAQEVKIRGSHLGVQCKKLMINTGHKKLERQNDIKEN